MLQDNTVLQELDVEAPREDFDECILSDVIQPYFRRLAHVRAFGKYRGAGYAQLVNDSPALIWMNIPTILGLGDEK
jgi:hypothetical protein